MDLSKVYHVGFLNTEELSPRPITSYSLEGDGLSVSLHPNEWIKIAKLGGRNLYILQKDSPAFFMALESDTEKAIEWAVANDYIKPAKKRRGYFSDEDGDEFYTELDPSDDENEYEEVRVVDDYIFSNKGKSYWQSFCSSEVSHFHAKDFAIIFYAQNHGYDGVWWNEDLAPAKLSAPRGVIFQDKLSEWKISLCSDFTQFN